MPEIIGQGNVSELRLMGEEEEEEENYLDWVLSRNKIRNRRPKKKKKKLSSGDKDRPTPRRRRKRDRAAEIQAQLMARKDNIERNCGRYRRSNCMIQNDDYDYYDEDFVSLPEILPAQDLGIESGPMYDRLLEIIQGGDIEPEDYDLLLQLDTQNEKRTMTVDALSTIPILMRGEVDLEGGGCCHICLTSWSEVPAETALRRLPCNHIFCQECIDPWLSEVSNKCPNLSCYWNCTNETR